MIETYTGDKKNAYQGLMVIQPLAGLEPAIFALGGRRLIHWATGAASRYILNIVVHKYT